LVPPAIAVCFVLVGWDRLALYVGVVGTAVALLAACWPRFGALVAVVAEAIAAAAGRVLALVLLGAAHLLLITPLALVARLVGRDPLRPRGAGVGWRPRARQRALVGRTYADERVERSRQPDWRLRGGVLVLVVVVLVLADVGLGRAWDRVVGVEPLPEGRLTDTSFRAESPAMEDLPWAEAYFEELDSVRSRFDPFLINRSLPFDGELITIDERGRASYEPEDLPVDAPTVWFFGGSTTYGEGQRDEHTIPSEVARLAERAGTPIRAVNYGERGWVLWQELLRFEQELAVQPAPDLVVFYDGTNDLNVQATDPTGQPSVYDAAEYRARISGDPTLDPVHHSPSLVERWRADSLLLQLVAEARESLGMLVPAGQSSWSSEEREAAVQPTVEVYRRGRALVLDVAAAHGVPVAMFWQPERDGRDERSPGRRAAALAGAPTIDLSGALDEVDPDDVYIDGAHTNELGARIVAEHLWVHVQPTVACLADAVGDVPGACA
jgi:lysophospholipase L1-like esterase